METLNFLSAFMIGLLGSGHCAVMCGGVSTMLCSAISPHKAPPAFIAAYNIGRLTSYSIAGALTGYLGYIASSSLDSGLGVLRLMSGIFLILIALYIGKWSSAIVRVEKLGKYLWRFIQPLAKHVMPVQSITKALGLGAIWGWLPCGLVYSALTWSLASGSAAQGALLMLGFGLGTLPAILFISVYSFYTKKILQNPVFNIVSALTLALYGFYTITIALRLLLS